MHLSAASDAASCGPACPASTGVTPVTAVTAWPLDDASGNPGYISYRSYTGYMSYRGYFRRPRPPRGRSTRWTPTCVLRLGRGRPRSDDPSRVSCCGFDTMCSTPHRHVRTGVRSSRSVQESVLAPVWGCTTGGQLQPSGVGCQSAARSVAHCHTSYSVVPGALLTSTAHGASMCCRPGTASWCRAEAWSTAMASARSSQWMVCTSLAAAAGVENARSRSSLRA